MKTICPNAQVVGIGRLKHWHWQINTKGFANIVEAPAAPYSPGTARWLGPLGGDLREDKERVYGIVYRLERGDEAVLEKAMGEGGRGYTKETQQVEFWGRWQDNDGTWKAADLKNGRIQRVRVALYADRKDITDGGKPSPEYLLKLSAGIRDAVGEGIPKGYFDEYVRPFLANEEEVKALSLAIQDAIKKGVDVRRLVEQAEQEFSTTGVNDISSGQQAQAR
jgi:gamma-glutamylcyclotransferase